MSTSTAKRRIAGLVSLSAVIATMVVAAAPTASLAAADCQPTGFVRDGIDLTAAKIGGTVTGTLDATGCDIGAYNPTKVANADIRGARYYGVVVNGRTVNTTNSKVHRIGDSPFDGMQRGRAILYINGADGTISGNEVYSFQKNGIEVRGLTADASGPASDKSIVTVANNVVRGRGHIGDIAQNGIVAMGNASVTVKNNYVSRLWYTGSDTYATGLLNLDATVRVSGNKFVDSQVKIDGAVKAIRNVHGSYAATIRSHGLSVHFKSEGQPTNTVIGKLLHWVVKVDGRTTVDLRQRFSDHDDYAVYFATGDHRVNIYKNGDLVRTIVVKA